MQQNLNSNIQGGLQITQMKSVAVFFPNITPYISLQIQKADTIYYYYSSMAFSSYKNIQGIFEK